jgi:hypothetical protein
MTRDSAGADHAEPSAPTTPMSQPRPDPEQEHDTAPGGPLATPSTTEGREAAEAQGEEA